MAWVQTKGFCEVFGGSLGGQQRHTPQGQGTNAGDSGSTSGSTSGHSPHPNPPPPPGCWTYPEGSYGHNSDPSPFPLEEEKLMHRG